MFTNKQRNFSLATHASINWATQHPLLGCEVFVSMFWVLEDPLGVWVEIWVFFNWGGDTDTMFRAPEFVEECVYDISSSYLADQDHRLQNHHQYITSIPTFIILQLILISNTDQKFITLQQQMQVKFNKPNTL